MSKPEVSFSTDSFDADRIASMTLHIAGKSIASATWAVIAPGVVQIVRLEVEPSLRRQGYGTLLGRRLIETIARKPARRILVHIQQKSQLPARAWLTRMGFHHVSTTSNQLPDEDIMTYVLGLD
jgi:ribosomal protein S18 acetylase RimI-like enzyme